MTTLLRTLPLALVALGASACGDFSQEDLLFMAAVPPKQALELLPAGVKSSLDRAESANSQEQGLEAECAPNDLRCEAAKIATGINGLTFSLLDVVDNVLAQPPTKREKNRRVWGPHYDAKSLATFRFEMIRSKDGSTFAFCLHAKKGAVRWGAADDVTCSDDVHKKSGLAIFLDGQFTPGSVEGAAAKSGVGSMSLYTERMDALNRIADRIDFDFDNAEGTQIDVGLGGVPFDDVAGKRDAAYSFLRRTDNSGTFMFEVYADLVEPLVGVGPEHIGIYAAWNRDQSGRALAAITEGDAPDGVETTQCWGSDQATTFLDAFDGTPTGDEALCTVDASAVPVPD